MQRCPLVDEPLVRDLWEKTEQAVELQGDASIRGATRFSDVQEAIKADAKNIVGWATLDRVVFAQEPLCFLQRPSGVREQIELSPSEFEELKRLWLDFRQGELLTVARMIADWFRDTEELDKSICRGDVVSFLLTKETCSVYGFPPFMTEAQYELVMDKFQTLDSRAGTKSVYECQALLRASDTELVFGMGSLQLKNLIRERGLDAMQERLFSAEAVQRFLALTATSELLAGKADTVSRVLDALAALFAAESSGSPGGSPSDRIATSKKRDSRVLEFC